MVPKLFTYQSELRSLSVGVFKDIYYYINWNYAVPNLSSFNKIFTTLQIETKFLTYLQLAMIILQVFTSDCLKLNLSKKTQIPYSKPIFVLSAFSTSYFHAFIN